MRGAGKTRLALEGAISLMRGVGLLERQRKDKAKPVKVLFCASDSGAEPLKGELLEMGIDPDTDELFQGDLWQLWAHGPGTMDAWGAAARKDRAVRVGAGQPWRLRVHRFGENDQGQGWFLLRGQRTRRCISHLPEGSDLPVCHGCAPGA